MEQSLLTVSFLELEVGSDTSLRVPVPRVLIDPESPVNFRAFDDHIEVKLSLLLPVDHPLVSGLDFPEPEEKPASDTCFPFSVNNEIKKLSAMEEVHFYCRSCSTKLTKGIRLFNEMPSVDWQDVADNWFGTCCCSFGGISEKLVMQFAKSYSCTPGVCLITGASVIICKEDLVGCEFPEPKGDKTYYSQVHSAEMTCLISPSPVEENIGVKPSNEVVEKMINGDSSTCIPLKLKDDDKVKSLAGISIGCCTANMCERSPKEKEYDMSIELLDKQKIFLKGCLGDAFMLRHPNLSKDVKWIEFLCPECSSLIGSYPCSSDNAPLDDGVRLYKHNISTGLPVHGLNDLFRKVEEWVTKNHADEVYMLPSQVTELITNLEMANDMLPPSHVLLQDFYMSSLKR